MTFTQSGAGTVIVFDGSLSGADYNAGNLYDTIAVFNDAGSATAISVQLIDAKGAQRYVTGREATLPAGQGAGFSWPGHPIVQVKVIFTGAATIYVCPIK